MGELEVPEDETALKEIIESFMDESGKIDVEGLKHAGYSICQVMDLMNEYFRITAQLLASYRQERRSKETYERFVDAKISYRRNHLNEAEKYMVSSCFVQSSCNKNEDLFSKIERFLSRNGDDSETSSLGSSSSESDQGMIKHASDPNLSHRSYTNEPGMLSVRSTKSLDYIAESSSTEVNVSSGESLGSGRSEYKEISESSSTQVNESSGESLESGRSENKEENFRHCRTPTAYPFLRQDNRKPCTDPEVIINVESASDFTRVPLNKGPNPPSTPKEAQCSCSRHAEPVQHCSENDEVCERPMQNFGQNDEACDEDDNTVSNVRPEAGIGADTSENQISNGGSDVQTLSEENLEEEDNQQVRRKNRSLIVPKAKERDGYTCILWTNSTGRFNIVQDSEFRHVPGPSRSATVWKPPDPRTIAFLPAHISESQAIASDEVEVGCGDDGRFQYELVYAESEEDPSPSPPQSDRSSAIEDSSQNDESQPGTPYFSDGWNYDATPTPSNFSEIGDEEHGDILSSDVRRDEELEQNARWLLKDQAEDNETPRTYNA